MTTLRPYDMGINETTINEMAIESISWGKFKGQVPQNPPYYAHIYWNIDYKYSFNDPNSFKPTIAVKPYISPKSWMREENVNDKLLKHEYGHYLIGCICALKFQQRVHKTDPSLFNSKDEAIKYCQLKFKQTLKQYLKIQRKYDDETDHYYDEEGQQKWQKWIANQLNKRIIIPVSAQVGKQVSQNKTEKTTISNDRGQSKQSKRSRQSSTGKYRSNLSVQSNRRRVTVSSSRNIRIRKASAMKYPPLPNTKRLASFN